LNHSEQHLKSSGAMTPAAMLQTLHRLRMHRSKVQVLHQKTEALHREAAGKVRQQLADKHALAAQQTAAQSKTRALRLHIPNRQ
jgi:hypothetical protein